MNDNKSNTPANEKDLAQTPWWFIESLQSFLCRPFDLDVCASQKTAKVLSNYYSLDEGSDGLKLPWCANNWCNPPFSDILPWLHKASIEAENGNTSVVIFPDAPETGYSTYAAHSADTLIRMPFRLKFLRPDGTPFTDDKGRIQSPRFPVVAALFTPIGLRTATRFVYHDFSKGFMP